MDDDLSQNENKLGLRLRELLRERRMTQESVVDRLSETDKSITAATISRWITGRHLPQERKLRLVLTAAGAGARQTAECLSLLRQARGGELILENSASWDRAILWRGLIGRSGHSNAWIAQQLGVNHTAVSRWRSGQRLPSKACQEQLLDLLDAPVIGRPYLRYEADSFSLWEQLSEPRPKSVEQTERFLHELWQQELAGRLGDEGDLIFFLLEDCLLPRALNGDPRAPLVLARALLLHCDWRGRHGFSNRDRDFLLEKGLAFLHGDSSEHASLRISLKHSRLSTIPVSKTRSQLIRAHTSLISEITERGGVRSCHDARLPGIRASLAHHLLRVDPAHNAWGILHDADRGAREHSEITGEARLLNAVCFRKTEIFLRLKRFAEAAKTMPPVVEDGEGSRFAVDGYGRASRQMQHARVSLGLRRTQEAHSWVMEAEQTISQFQVFGLSSALLRLQQKV